MPEDLWETRGGAHRVQRAGNGHGNALLKQARVEAALVQASFCSGASH